MRQLLHAPKRDSIGESSFQNRTKSYAAISRWPVNSIYRMKPLATAAAFFSLVSQASIRLSVRSPSV